MPRVGLFSDEEIEFLSAQGDGNWWAGVEKAKAEYFAKAKRGKHSKFAGNSRLFALGWRVVEEERAARRRWELWDGVLPEAVSRSERLAGA